MYFYCYFCIEVVKYQLPYLNFEKKLLPYNGFLKHDFFKTRIDEFAMRLGIFLLKATQKFLILALFKYNFPKVSKLFWRILRMVETFRVMTERRGIPCTYNLSD